MKRILALLLAVTCTMGTLCACGGATSGSGSAANDETSSFTNDDHDNSITVGIAQDLDESLDPYTITAAGTREVLFNIYEGLVNADSTGNFNPAVAKEYKLSADKLTYTFTLRDNIYLPLVLAGTDYREMQQKLRPIADQLGISDILAKYPYEVSGGQKQRAAVARALITDPQLILADEPTGALDSRSSDALLELFGELNGTGQTILMVTHSVNAASHAGRVLFLRDGQVYHQLYRGGESQEAQFRRISDTLTVLAGGGEPHA